MEKATRYRYGRGRQVRRRGRLPRVVVWLALLIALAVAALGAAVTWTRPAQAATVDAGAPGARAAR